MVLALALGSSLLLQRPAAAVRVGWNDELNSVRGWKALEVENRPSISQPKRGAVLLSLSPKGADWPYEFQWSGITRDAKVDIARFPVLTARVRDVHGYAHLDIEVLDAEGKALKGFRSTTVTTEGLSTIDLGQSLDPAVYTLRLRLIVGGPNAGCDVTYDWVRFTNRADAEFLAANPTWQRVVRDGRLP